MITRYSTKHHQTLPEESLQQIRKASTIGEKLIIARDTAQMTQLEAARALGLKSTGTISFYENNTRRPSLNALQKFSVLYGIDPIELIPPDDPYLVPFKRVGDNTANPIDAPSRLSLTRFLSYKVTDNLMSPVFLKGDLVKYDPDRKIFFSGQFVLIRTESTMRVCQIFLKNNLPVQARVLHPLYALKPIKISAENVVGIVVELSRSFYPPPNEFPDWEDSNE